MKLRTVYQNAKTKKQEHKLAKQFRQARKSSRGKQWING